MKRNLYVVCAVILALAVILSACTSASQPVQAPVPQPLHVVVDNAAEFTGIGGEGEGEQGLVGAPTNIRSLVAGEIYDKGTLAVDGASTLTGAVTMAAAASVGTALTVGTYIDHGDQSAVTVTNGSTIAVTDDFVPLTAAGSVATATFTGCNTLGKVTYFYNTANQTITITDTGTLKLSGNLALGQYDTFITVGDGSNCLQVATTNN